MTECEYKRAREFMQDRHESDMKALDRVYALTREIKAPVPVIKKVSEGLYAFIKERIEVTSGEFRVNDLIAAVRVHRPEAQKQAVYNVVNRLQKEGRIESTARATYRKKTA